MTATGTMDFFQSQDVARRKTSLLVVYYFLAVMLIMVAVYAAFALTFLGARAKAGAEGPPPHFWNPTLFLAVMGGTLAVVAIGSLYKISQLAKGGEAVASLLGGRLINANTRDTDERKVLNVVEEMAIASGTAVPRVYVLEQEEGINAFAAGFSTDDCVIGVTKGCIGVLSRDELQGVIAHEFSHILNGDMRLNLRLLGVLHGILVIGLVGYWVLRSTMMSGRRSRSSRDKGNSMPIALLGLAIMVIGFVGVFFAKLIKSAVSRQREFLADASSVQFTRNPSGIAGALKKIGGYASGSRVSSPHAEEASHFFFSNGLTQAFMGLMATHPPLEERIRRLDSSFEEAATRTTGAAPPAPGRTSVTVDTGPVSGFAVNPDAIVNQVGTPSHDHLRFATAVMQSLPKAFREAAHEPFGARAVVYALLLNQAPDAHKSQMERLQQHADPAVFAETRKLVAVLGDVRSESRLALADIAVSSLKDLAPGQYEAFAANVQHLVEADKQVDLFEYALQRMIERRLGPVFRDVKRPGTQYYSMGPLKDACTTLLSCLAYWGTDDMTDAQSAFAKGVAQLDTAQVPDMATVDECGLTAVDRALDTLVLASPRIKKKVLRSCTSCVAADGRVTIEEAELLRAVADALDCPMPPILPSEVPDTAA